MGLGLPRCLMLASTAVMLLLGTAHLLLTFYSHEFRPRDTVLESHMRDTSPRLSNQFSMWNAWVGYNASHSLGAIVFAVLYGYFALCHAELLFHGRFLGLFGSVVLGSYLALAWKYWFSSPLLGITLASLLYAGAFFAARF
ncbi:MAG TPA: hypothetical protein VNX47_05655 [Nevskia sp.]|nr:hypothetical protein [Nevskia sp.]